MEGDHPSIPVTVYCMFGCASVDGEKDLGASPCCRNLAENQEVCLTMHTIFLGMLSLELQSQTREQFTIASKYIQGIR